MTAPRILFLLFILVTGTSAADLEAELKASLDQAAKAKKDLMLIFRGPSSSPPCKATNEQVLDSEAFKKAIAGNFVVLSLPDPSDAGKAAGWGTQHRALLKKMKVTFESDLFS